MKKELIEKVNQGILNESIIINCLAKIETLISKASYQKAKWKNAGSIFVECYKADFNKYIGYRNTITRLLLTRYNLDSIKSMVKAIDVKDCCTVKMCDMIYDMACNGDYVLEDSL